jgi:hypothetical protein
MLTLDAIKVVDFTQAEMGPRSSMVYWLTWG